MFTHREQPTSLLQDVSRAASRIAEESKGLAEVARSELGDLSRDLRDQASGTATQARRVTAARLAGAADTVEPRGKKRFRRFPLLLAVVAGAVAAVTFARARKRTAPDEERPADEPGVTERSGPAARRTAAPAAKAGGTGTTVPASSAASTGGNRSSS